MYAAFQMVAFRPALHHRRHLRNQTGGPGHSWTCPHKVMLTQGPSKTTMNKTKPLICRIEMIIARQPARGPWRPVGPNRPYLL